MGQRQSWFINLDWCGLREVLTYLPRSHRLLSGRAGLKLPLMMWSHESGYASTALSIGVPRHTWKCINSTRDCNLVILLCLSPICRLMGCYASEIVEGCSLVTFPTGRLTVRGTNPIARADIRFRVMLCHWMHVNNALHFFPPSLMSGISRIVCSRPRIVGPPGRPAQAAITARIALRPF